MAEFYSNHIFFYFLYGTASKFPGEKLKNL